MIPKGLPILPNALAALRCRALDKICNAIRKIVKTVFLMDGIEVEAFRLEPPFIKNVLVRRFIFRLRPKLILT